MSRNNSILVVKPDGTTEQTDFYAARNMANSCGLDLVQVNSTGPQRVFKIMDKGKWSYEQKKKQKQNKHHAHTLKEVKFRLRIEKHDQDVKMNRIKKFLEKGHNVQITVELIGREKARPHEATVKLRSLLEELDDIKSGEMKKSSRGSSLIVQPAKK